jgi:NAD+ dependent glucose-6-phosphate dehydrogenase
MSQTILITGATGNLGSKLSKHLEGRFALRLLDIDPRGDGRVVQADLSQWGSQWVKQFQGVDTIVHLAADPRAHVPWPDLVRPNLDALINVFLAAASARVRRVIFASSNHVMGGYQHEATPAKLAPDTPPQPGAKYLVDGEPRDSTPYGSAKLFGERLGKCFADAHNVSVIAVRIGWVRPGDNRPEDIPPERGPWFKLMWLSNRDFCQVMEKCITAGPSIRFAVVNAMSDNAGMRWDLEPTRKLLGYEPADGLS